MKKKQINRLLALGLSLSMAMSVNLTPVMADETAIVTDEVIETALEEEPASEAVVASEETTEAETPAAEEITAAPVEEAATPETAVPTEDTPAVSSTTGLIDFTSPTDDLIIDAEKHTVTLTNNGGDHFAAYNGMDQKVNNFTLEADVTFKEGQNINSAALIFGLSSKTAPGTHWNGANCDSGRIGSADGFRMFGPEVGGEVACGNGLNVDFSKPVHFKMEVNEKGEFTYSFGNNDGEMNSKSGTLASWEGGYVGLLTWNSEATFSNIAFEGTFVEKEVEKTKIVPDARYTTNLSELSVFGGNWEITDAGLQSDATGLGDCFLFSETKAGDFVYSTDVKFLSDGGAAALIFRNGSTTNNKDCYAVNLDNGSKMCKVWRWTDGNAGHLINDKPAPASEDGVYNLKVVVIGNWVSYYVNDVLIASSGDYTLQPDDRGQTTIPKDGYLGLLNWNGNMVFQNTCVASIENVYDPTLTDISVASSTGTVEAKTQFSPNEPITLQYVTYDASTVDIIATAKCKDAVITVSDPDGNIYKDGKNVPVQVGVNYITVESTVTAPDGTEATLTYRVNVHRRQPDSVYYNEPYRDQYHYSVKDGWANDPNGLVYYKGTYHFFYQFYDAKQWGPMHWAHATSKDLIHWTEEPIAFYPDANGAMFSGCIAVDENNASGLFSTDEGGLIAFITCDGNGQRIKLAYSEDEGKTWQKVDEIAADWTNDPLGTDAFRDPKVFRWENKWFMVVAGGPLRIYSSENMVDWQVESTYANLHTECPDLYPIMADDGQVKWVLSRGGRFYKVGDFTNASGKWRFVPDAEYADKDGVMNFGKDSYAAMTFYVQDFGTAANPTLPQIVEINWMNTWDDYCNAVANKVGQDFNGTFNLALAEGLIKDGDTYVLTQRPVAGYDSLRGDAVVDLKGATVTPDNTILENFSGDVYEIVSTFYPGEATEKVGFKVRVGEGESTDIIYDIKNETLSIDRSKSGIIISGRFQAVDSQQVKRNADGSISLHIYVDKASVEVFTNGYTAAGANQIFPSIDSLGAQVVCEGGDATADITIYPMDTIWDKVESDVPAAMTTTAAAETNMYVNDQKTVKVTLLPINVDQDVTWSVADPSVVTVESKGASAVLTALQKGSTTVTATATANPEISKTFTVKVLENNFKTNLKGWTEVNGTWVIDDETLYCSNRSSNDFYMSSEPIPYEEFTLETKVKFPYGIINIFFAGNSMDPFDHQAYAVQVAGGNSNVRLFRFAGDTIAESSMGKTIDDNEFHDIKITKTVDTVIVAVDGVECMNKTLDAVEPFFNTNPYVGIGLWDGVMEAQTFYVNPLKGTEPVDPEDPEDPDQPDDPTDTRKENTITASDITVNASAKVQTVKIKAKAKAGKLSYESDNESVTVDKNGKVTIKAGYVGKATITIKAEGNKKYKPASKEITVTVQKVEKHTPVIVKVIKGIVKAILDLFR
ncbi:MAG: GH32 C-terminal domain-containing protein [Lachnospiraceae bacterium]|nr:GH32 C-terminal domain-containing protein [Lachnospiraceae bacterium]